MNEKLSKAMVEENIVSDKVLDVKLAVGGSLVIFVVFYALQVRLSRLEGMRDDVMNYAV